MKYNVKEPFSLDVGKPDPVEVEAGSVFIPAETNVSRKIVEGLVLSGKIELIKPGVAEPEPAPKSKKK